MAKMRIFYNSGTVSSVLIGFLIVFVTTILPFTGCKKKKDDIALLLLGSAVHFDHNPGNGSDRPWIQDAYLKASNARTDDNYGVSVALSGNTIVVGANAEDGSQTTITNDDGLAGVNDGALQSGAAYVYKIDNSGNWIQDAYLKASNTEAGDIFGYAVSISGDTIVVGAQGESGGQTTITNTDGQAAADNTSPMSGAVYVFKKDGGGNWIQDAYLKASNAQVLDYLGDSVSISIDTIAVGVPRETSSATGIVNANGAPNTNPGIATESGAVYIFVRDNSGSVTGTPGNWYQDAYLKASNADVNDHFGLSVAVSGDTIVVGAPDEDGSETGIINTDDSVGTDSVITEDSGAVYVFQRDGSGNWYQDAYLKASNVSAGDSFGYSVAVSGNTIAVGSYYEDSGQTTITNIDDSASGDNSTTHSGAVYVFRKDTDGSVTGVAGDWYQDAYLKASNAQQDDGFGSAVAVSGDTVVVGALGEDSSQTNITNDDGSASGVDDASLSGAVYVFKRDGSGDWIQDAYLKASNAGGIDLFGFSVSTSSDTIAVGARQEDSGQTAITNDDNSAAADNSAQNSGAAYVFRR